MFYFKRINRCEDVDQLNIEIRKEFIKRYKDSHIYGGLIPIILCSGLNVIYYVLIYELKLAVSFFILPILLFLLIFKIYYNVLYGRILEEDYQWGNDGFEDFELYTLNKMKDYDLAKEYYNESVREQEDYYYDETYKYGRKGMLLKYIIIILTSLALLLNVSLRVLSVF